MQTQVVIGIDPGASGSMVALDVNGDVVSYEKNNATLTDRVMWLRELADKHCVVYAILEKVHAMPKQGVSSTFKFGQNFGECETLLTSHLIRTKLVTPQTWQKAMGCMTKGDKNVSKNAAQNLFPSIKVTHALADALLIAEYARREAIELQWINL